MNFWFLCHCYFHCHFHCHFHFHHFRDLPRPSMVFAITPGADPACGCRHGAGVPLARRRRRGLCALPSRRLRRRRRAVAASGARRARVRARILPDIISGHTEACARVCACAQMRIRTFACFAAHEHMRTCAHMSVCKRAHVHASACVHAHLHVHMCAHVLAHPHVDMLCVCANNACKNAFAGGSKYLPTNLRGSLALPSRTHSLIAVQTSTGV